MVDSTSTPAGDHKRRRYVAPVDWEEASFVTLAKAGGRRDLLCHLEHELTPGEPCSYPRVEWFDHLTPEPRSSPPSRQAELSLLQWERGSEGLKLPPIKAAGRGSLMQTQPEVLKLPAISSQEGVEFSRLMSMDYQREWLEKTARRKAHERQKARAKRAAQRQKMAEHTVRARKIAGVDGPPQPKSRFVMKKFSGIPSKFCLPQQ